MVIQVALGVLIAVAAGFVSRYCFKRAIQTWTMPFAHVKSLLGKNLESIEPTLDLGPLPTHENIRGGAYFANEETSCAK